MSRVFIFGASGFIGSHVAQAFRREGYTVTGLTRTEEKAKILRSHEINAIVGTAQDKKVWESAVEQADIVIESMQDNQDYKAGVSLFESLQPLIKNSPSKVFIYTSGVWVYGNHGSEVIDENTKLTPAPLVKERPALEKAYSDLGVIVVRPGCVYGKSGSLTSMWIADLKKKGEFPGDGKHSWAMVHVNDLADAYVKAAQKGGAIKGQYFNFVAQSEKIKDCLEALAPLAGFKGEVKFFAPTDPFSECLAMNQIISGQKARFVLGWVPKHPTFTAGAKLYFQAVSH